MNEIFLTSDQLAKRWVIRTETLSQWRWNGRGPQYLKIGRRVLYRIEDVLCFEEQKRRQNTSVKSDQLMYAN